METQDNPSGLQLTPEEVRVLGSLVEKAITTPDNYPLTLNALRAACNQKSNREPVVDYDDRTVVRVLDDLRDKKLVWMITSAGGRVPKYEHSLAEKLPLPPAQMAVLCLLMLRGPQTAGELKTRTERMHPFVTVTEVEHALQQLIDREACPLVQKLPVLPGKREPRYAHRLGGEVEMQEAPEPAAPEETARAELRREEERLQSLETELATMRAELRQLHEEFARFRAQFE